MKRTTSTLLFTALALGLAWAVRGHFGHEWGAAWAGGIGTLALVLMSGRADWQSRAPVLGSLGAIGWAIGGMMSYGMVIGYCRGSELGNVWYGYAMLAVIGGLYGFLGGGFVGLGLSAKEEKKPAWASLITQMVAGAYLFWGFFIFQLEWFMTPPRSELWAACLGAAAAMAWYMYREGFHKAGKVALYTGLGAGFGFAFGNFLQTMGATTGISYNWWNVMEFTLGAFGGLGMSYGVMKQQWPKTADVPVRQGYWGLLFLFILVPFINFTEAFSNKKLTRLAESLSLSQTEAFISNQQLWGAGIALGIILFVVLIWRGSYRSYTKVQITFFALALLYVLWSYIIKGVFLGKWGIAHSESTYVPILIVLGLLSTSRSTTTAARAVAQEGKPLRVEWLLAALILSTLIFAWVSVQLHEGLPGAQTRF